MSKAQAQKTYRRIKHLFNQLISKRDKDTKQFKLEFK